SPLFDDAPDHQIIDRMVMLLAEVRNDEHHPPLYNGKPAAHGGTHWPFQYQCGECWHAERCLCTAECATSIERTRGFCRARSTGNTQQHDNLHLERARSVGGN